MPAHMRALPKPAPGTARAMQRARARLAKTRLAAACGLVRERDGGRCRVCGDPRDVEVHHIVFRSQGGGHETSNLICLCRVCHSMVHARRVTIAGNADEKVRVTHPDAFALCC